MAQHTLSALSTSEHSQEDGYRRHLLALKCSLLHRSSDPVRFIVLCMEKLAPSICEHVGTISDEEIVQRFEKVFRREMTASERSSFLLPNQEAIPPSTKG